MRCVPKLVRSLVLPVWLDNIINTSLDLQSFLGIWETSISP